MTFGAIYKLHELGADKITLESISDFFSSRPKSGAIYKQNKGEEWLLKISQSVTAETFDYYYSRMKKFSLLRAYDKYGIDVSDIYDVDNLLDTKKKQQQEELLDNSTLEQIADKVDSKIESIRLQYVDDAFGEAVQAGQGIDNLIDKLKAHPEVGSPLYGPLINTVTRGARLKKLYLRSAATGIGKAIPDYTVIPTPNGYRQVGDIKPGDYLFGQDGKPTKVLATYPQPEEKEIWKITFSDGRVAECCGEHLWDIYYGKRKTHKVMSLEEIYKEILDNGYQYSSSGEFRYKILNSKTVEYSTKNFKCSPYALGALLGDGCLVESTTNHLVLFSSTDIENVHELEKELQAFGVKRSGDNYNWIFRKSAEDKNSGIWTKELLEGYPALINTKSENKFIPKDYLLGNFQQRLDLLNGLLDTDGSVDKTGRRITYSTISKQLSEDVKELCRSLGIIVSEAQVSDNYYLLQLHPTEELRELLFRLPRKRQRINNNTSNYRYNKYIAIVNIEKTKAKTTMTCFTVDNPDHLFLMNDYLVTHNTRAMIADACYIACNKIYDSRFGWIHNGQCEPVLFIATEQDLEEVQTMMLAFLSEVNEEHILNGQYLNGEEDRVRTAAKLIKEAPLYVEYLPDFSLKDIEDRIKKNIRDNDVKYCFLDYIHSSMKILEEITRRSGGVKLREDNILFMLSTKLKDICNQYGVFIMSATQLNGKKK